MIRLYICSLVILLLALYVTWLERQNTFLYQVRRSNSKSAKVLKGMGVKFYSHERTGFSFKKETIVLGSLAFSYHVFLCFKSPMCIIYDGVLMRYNDISFSFRKVVYLIYLKKRYVKLFQNISIDKQKVLKDIEKEAKAKEKLKSMEVYLKDVIEKLCQ